MSYSRSKKILLILGLMVFFVLFLPATDNLIIAQAKDITSSEEPVILPEIKLNVKSKELVKGKSYNLKVYNTTDMQTISFKSSNSAIASVSDTGTVKGLDIGTATIYVTVKEDTKVITTLQCEITVGVPAISIRLTQSNIILVVGQKTSLKALVAPYNTVEVARFTSLNSDTASISTGGRITAKSAGSTYVYGIIDNGYSKCKVSVIDEATYNILNESGYSDLSTITDLDAVLLEITSGSAIKVTPESENSNSTNTNNVKDESNTAQ